MTVYTVRRRPRYARRVAPAVAAVGAWTTLTAALVTVGIGAFLLTVGWGPQ